ncbi:MAG: signal peptidase I [archaeon YNP-LCB-024-027]|jgi:signal peptidase|nr:signal peptidase I [Candidatus Culexarchaeum yellowstonense]
MGAKDKRRVSKRDIIGYIALIALAIIISRGIYYATGFILNVPTPFLVVASGSMEPTLNVGDVIIIRGVNPEDLKVGDIIVFNPPQPYYNGVPWVHRIISIQKIGNEIYFRTRGDANAYPDPFTLTKSNIVGVMIGKIPYLGLISLNLWQWLIPAIVIMAIIIVLKIISESGENK